MRCYKAQQFYIFGMLDIFGIRVFKFPLVLQLIEGRSLSTDCWPHFYLSTDRVIQLIQPISGLCVLSTLNPPAIVCFMDRDYRYKSVATHITHEAVLAPMPMMTVIMMQCT